MILLIIGGMFLLAVALGLYANWRIGKKGRGWV